MRTAYAILGYFDDNRLLSHAWFTTLVPLRRLKAICWNMGVNGDALINGEFFGGELRKKYMTNQTHGIVRQPAPEPRKGGMIRIALIKGKTPKLLEGDPIFNMGF